MASRTVLGLDLGTNSIGWCLVEEIEKNVPDKVLTGGVRIFQEAVEAKTRTPKNKTRRDARLLRRVIQRRARRKRKLRNYLIFSGCLPPELATSERPEEILNAIGNPYALRKKGLDDALTQEEFGRVLLHICARRGFLSNRKTALMDLYRSGDPDVLEALSGDKDDSSEFVLSEEDKEEETSFKKDIAELRGDIKSTKSRTLGEYLADLPLHERKRCRRTERKMYEDEFNALWEVQQQFHPTWCTEDVRLATYGVIFFQRPLKLKKGRRGRCSLEPTRYRAAKATLEAQEFRLLQDINHLQCVDISTGEFLRLDEDQRKLLIEKLSNQGSMTWGAARKLLGFNSKVKFNLENSKANLLGNRTATSIMNLDKDWWDGLEYADKLSLVEDLLTIKNRYALYKRLIEFWKFEPRTALNYAVLEFEPGHANVSLKAIRNLLPHLRSGLIYSDARIVAGYGYEPDTKALSDRLGEPLEARNPVVQKAIFEVRKLVNAIIRAHGKPDAVRIEMARDLKLTKKMKANADKQAKKNEAANKEAAVEYEKVRGANPHIELTEFPSRDDLLRYRLWKEADGLDIYTGQSISITQLWTAEIEVDHILPYSRTLDDSYMNKMVCYATANRDKSNSTPYEMWGGDPSIYDDIKQRARKCPLPKQKRFLRKELDKIDDFISRQLNDTRYISKLVLGYMKTAFPDVAVTTGSVTAFLRHQWGLNSVLSESSEKNRADHRHHFVDAAVIALVNRRTYQLMAREASRSDLDAGIARLSRLDVEPPIKDLRKKIQDIADGMVISHAVTHKISGALHEDTYRGVSSDGWLTLRVPVDANLTEANVAKVIDPNLRERLNDHIAKNGNKAKQAFAQPVPLGNGRYLRHVKIRTGKVPKVGAYFELSDRLGNVQRRAVFGNTHHVKLCKNAAGKVKADFVTAFEAASRAGDPNVPVIDRSVGDGEKLIGVLHGNDSVTLNVEGKTGLYRVVSFEKDTNRIILIGNRVAISTVQKPLKKAVGTLVEKYNLVPVSVDLLGSVIPS